MILCTVPHVYLDLVDIVRAFKPSPEQKITHTSASAEIIDSAVAFLWMITIEGTTLHSCRILQDDLLIQVGVLNEPN